MALKDLITAYEAATVDFLDAARSLREEDLDKAPEGEWSARMVVHHLAHADAYCLTRIIQVFSEPGTDIRSFSEEALAGSAVLAYRSAPIAPSLSLFAATRGETLRLLKNATDADLALTCNHSEYGPITLEKMVTLFTDHPRGHIRQILDAVKN